MMVGATGDIVTFEDFFRREYPRLVPMLRALTGDVATAEDVAQEALAKAGEHWERISHFDQPGAWVRRVALNASINVHRRRQREARALLRVGPPATAAAPTDDDAELWRLVRELPDQQRCAVVLRYVEDRSVHDIAHVLRCSEGAVKTHLSRARASLAAQLRTPRSETSS